MGEKEPEKQEGEKKSGDGAAPAAAGGGGGPVTVVLKVDLHCEGCAQKVKKNLKHMNGVETVKADYTSSKVIVVGKVDPAVVRGKVEEKTKKKVELVSPLPPKKDKAEEGGGVDAIKPDEKSEKKPDDAKKDEEKKPKEPPPPPPVVTVVVKTRVHCDGCAYKMKKIISKYDGVQDVNVDLAKDQITIKGTMDMKEMLPYLNTKLKRPVDIVPPPAKKDDGEKKPKEGGDAGGDKKGKEKDAEAAKPAADAGGDKKADAKPAAEESAPAKVETVNKMEHYGYPYGYEAHTYNPQLALENAYVAEYWHAPQPQPYMHAPQPYMPVPHPYMYGQYGAGPSYAHPPPPQMFSDENPNACSVM